MSVLLTASAPPLLLNTAAMNKHMDWFRKFWVNSTSPPRLSGQSLLAPLSGGTQLVGNVATLLQAMPVGHAGRAPLSSGTAMRRLCASLLVI